jgi:CCR4-NOT transcription complex subunit 9
MLENQSEKKRNDSTKDRNLREENAKIVEWVIELKDINLRENALAELSKKRESFPELAVYLWYSPGTVTSL